MQVKIYRPSRTTMQSGRARTASWVLEYELDSARRPDPLMGWASSADTNNQVKLQFDSLEKAQAYALKNGWAFTVLPSQTRVLKPRNYVDNFKYKPALQPKPSDVSAGETEKKGRPEGKTAQTAEIEKSNTAGKAAPTGKKVADAAIPGDKEKPKAKLPAKTTAKTTTVKPPAAKTK